MGALYPKPKERYDRFRLNESSPLYSSTTFLFIASPHLVTGSQVRESGPFSLVSAPQNFTPTVSFRPELGRHALYFPGNDSQKLLFTPTSRIYSGVDPISVIVNWRFDGSNQDQYAHLGGIYYDVYIWARQVYHSDWCVSTVRFAGSAYYEANALLTSFEDRWNATALSSRPNAHIVLVHNQVEYASTKSGNVSFTPLNISLGAWESGSGGNELKGWIADFAMFKTILTKPELLMLTEPDNHDYRIGGVPLLLPERPRFWAVSPIIPTTNKVPWHLLVQGAT